MAYQAPWRTAGDFRRRLQIVEKLDPILRDPATPPDARQRRREFLARHPDAGAEASPLDRARECSDDTEL
jgi:hypothetical protein